jgi:biopolymer transport protein ExbD
MAEVNTGGGGDEHKKGKPKKQQLRVDFTPMVDMNMLLITFFMFCTTLSKPQMLSLVMPSKDSDKVDEKEKPKVDETKTVTLLLGEKDIIYYYLGKPNFEDWQSLMTTDYSPEGLRKILLERNRDRIVKIADLRLQKAQNKITLEQFDEQVKKIRDEKGGQVVVIKPTQASTFENLVKVLDEMQICSIGTYAIVDMKDADNYLIDNYQQQGALTAQTSGVKKK